MLPLIQDGQSHIGVLEAEESVLMASLLLGMIDRVNYTKARPQTIAPATLANLVKIER